MGQLVVSVYFRQEISSICKNKMPQIDPENVKKFEVSVVFDAISVQFPRVFQIRSNTNNNKKRTMCKIFLKKALQRNSKTLQNDYK